MAQSDAVTFPQIGGPLAQCDVRENAWPNVTGTLGDRRRGGCSPAVGRPSYSEPQVGTASACLARVPRRRRPVAAGALGPGPGRRRAHLGPAQKRSVDDRNAPGSCRSRPAWGPLRACRAPGGRARGLNGSQRPGTARSEPITRRGRTWVGPGAKPRLTVLVPREEGVGCTVPERSAPGGNEHTQNGRGRT